MKISEGEKLPFAKEAKSMKKFSDCTKNVTELKTSSSREKLY